MTTLACVASLSAKVKFWWWSRHERHPGSAAQTSCKQSRQLRRLWRPPNTTAPMFRHLLPKIPEEVPIISEDYQMSQYEARNRAWSCNLLIEDTHATLSTVHSWTILFGKWTPFFTQLWVRSEKLFFTHVIACTWSVDMPRCGFCW